MMGNRLDFLLTAAAVAVFVAATVAMLTGREPFATWYYSFAWWSYIVFADAWNHRRTGRSALLRNSEAPQMLALSIVIWSTFETYNFRLGNWYYIDIPSNSLLRWLGYSIAYATVLPGIFVTADILTTVWPHRSRGQPGDLPQPRQEVSGEVGRARSGVRLPGRLSALLFWGGLIASILPWVWPEYFFPLVWLGPPALFMAINFRLGSKGLLSDLVERGWGKLYRLAAAGMICGLLWECWNYWARSKWVYEIPFLGGLPLFEMPIAGFLGFPPFAIACHEMYTAAAALSRRIRTHPLARFVFWLLLAILVGFVYRGIDAFTVRTFQS